MNRPVIGIVSRPANTINGSDIQAAEEAYRIAILNSGGIPFLILPPRPINYQAILPKDDLPFTEIEKQALNQILNLCDGFVMPGGFKTYKYDYYIYNYAMTHNIPILGICAGMQIMARSNQNATIVKNDTELNHYNEDNQINHPIYIDKTSVLYKILRKTKIEVNSYHNYHIENLKWLKISAFAPDGIPEAIEDPTKLFALGVQWHPEKRIHEEDQKKIFDYFIKKSLEKRKQKTYQKVNNWKIEKKTLFF